MQDEEERTPTSYGSDPLAPAAMDEAGEGLSPGEGDPAALLSAAEDRCLRLLAEFDNFRRRAARDREQAVEGAVESLVRPLLDVLDNLERALAHAGEAPPGPWIEGVALTVRQFHDALKAAGVLPIEPIGESFDPRYHEAVTTQPSSLVPADRILQVVSRGYRLGSRVLRPARVIVSRGDRESLEL